MQKLVFLFFLFVGFSAYSQKNVITNQVVDASCGQCNFKMKGKSCDLAVKINGKSYFIAEGAKIDDYGDAHAKDGFCNAVRKAEVSGVIKKGKFYATSFKLLPETAK